MSEETIAALATPPGQSGVAVVRVSGEDTRSVLQHIVRRAPQIWKTQRFYYREFAEADEIIDKGLVVFFAGPASYTGEDMAEFHVHGNPFLVQALLMAITRVKRVRTARPGEFSYRAYINGKMDLIEAEALGKLISAGSDTAYRLSLNAMGGGVGRLAGELRSALMDLSAWVEASIEFAEDQQLEMASLLLPLERAQQNLSLLLGKSAFYDRLSQGLRIIIAGPTNAGKSSLFNALLGDNRAIVSDIAGTTRDLLRERFYLHHVAVELLDTAGINPDSSNQIEREGVERGLSALQDASALLFVLDVSRQPQGWEMDVLNRFTHGPKVILLNKADLLNGSEPAHLFTDLSEAHRTILMSVKTGLGMNEVRSVLEAWSDQFKPSADDLLISHRQRELLEDISQGLARVLDRVQHGEMMELIAEEIRSINDNLSFLTGSLTPDDVLDRVFSSFCIGK